MKYSLEELEDKVETISQKAKEKRQRDGKQVSKGKNT